jgi:agmatinase
VGAPFDGTSSYRRGSRFAPDAIRRASLYMETLSLRTGLDLDDVKIADAGNVRGLESIEEAIDGVKTAVKYILGDGKVPIVIGGEHTVSLGALRALEPEAVVSFDAHLDLRDSLLGLRMSHATFMRRALEEFDTRLVVLGCRAFSKEEKEFASANDGSAFVTSAELFKHGVEHGAEAVLRELKDVSSVYLSIDMDVLDPAYAPAVGNPSPEGITVTMLLDLLAEIVDGRFLCFDVTEVTPHYDSGLTATHAAYITLETIYTLESTR